MQKLVIEFTVVRLIAHRQVEPCFFVNNGFCMRKSVKSGFAVICAYAAFADAAKTHAACCKMNYDVIYTAAAKGGFIGYAANVGFIV